MNCPYGAGFGCSAGRSLAAISDWKPIFLWVLSQKGLFCECPQRQRLTAVRPPRPKGLPSMSQISNSPSKRSGPLFRTVILGPAKGTSSKRLDHHKNYDADKNRGDGAVNGLAKAAAKLSGARVEFARPEPGHQIERN